MFNHVNSILMHFTPCFTQDFINSPPGYFSDLLKVDFLILLSSLHNSHNTTQPTFCEVQGKESYLRNIEREIS